MTDVEIYECAMEVIGNIASDLNERFYSKLGGSLSIHWDEGHKVNAWAQSNSDMNAPPVHTVGIHYELMRQIYRDIDAYCDYIESKIDDDLFERIFQNDPEKFDLMPSDFSSSEIRTNMFLGAITWVFFHEFTHLSQEHGLVRASSTCSIGSIIEENIDSSKEDVASDEALIFHVTELAADKGATAICLLELVRHFGDDLKNLEGISQIFVSGVSCLMYRFHGVKTLMPESEAKGTHPHPLVRLEHVIPFLQEMLSVSDGSERKSLVYRFSQAATSVGVFWLKHITVNSGIPDYSIFLQGTINRPGGINYLKSIINKWDEIEPVIISNRRFGDDFELLTFTPQYRSLIFDSSVNLPEIRSYVQKNKNC